jgi:hypothetical protein
MSMRVSEGNLIYKPELPSGCGIIVFASPEPSTNPVALNPTPPEL